MNLLLVIVKFQIQSPNVSNLVYVYKQIVDLIQNGEWSPATRKRGIFQEWIIQTKHNVLCRDEMLMLLQGKKFTLDLERAQEYISWIIKRE